MTYGHDAWALLSGPSGATTFAGGSYWFGDEIRSGLQITTTQLEDCLGAGSPVTNLVQTGAGPGSFPDQGYLRFSFRYRGRIYEFALKGRADTVIVATNPNVVPTADAGPDQNMASGAAVKLTGAGSDNPGQALTYAWTQTSGITVALSGADTVSIFVALRVNTPPLADAGPERTVNVLGSATIILIGAAASSNDVGQGFTYSWFQTGSPSVSLAGAKG